MEQQKQPVDNYLDTDSHRTPEEVPEKGSKRSLHIRRAIEDRFENKRLSGMETDNYWDGLA